MNSRNYQYNKKYICKWIDNNRDKFNEIQRIQMKERYNDIEKEKKREYYIKIKNDPFRSFNLEVKRFCKIKCF